jgi:biopolymer transport protein ExbB
MTQFKSITTKLNIKFAAALVAFAALGMATTTNFAQAQTAAPAADAAKAAAPAASSSAPAPAASSTAAAPTGAAAVKPPVVADENPYGLKALWAQGDIVAKVTLLILVIMSVGSWYIIFAKLLEQSKMAKQAAAAKKTFWSAGSVRQGADTLDAMSPYRFIADQGLEATKKHDGLLGAVDFNTWVTQGIERAMTNVQGRTQDGLAFLATVGATAPFVGLFGTVWGIYNALVKIGLSGQASIDKVAGPVGESLIMTAIGLAVAVPAVLGYNWLVRRNKAAMDNVREFGSDLHAVLLSTQGKK